jgi:EmrB/QacA subfamily drug resistance transporter
MRNWELDADKIHRRRWLTLAVLCISLIVIIVDNSIMNVALPTLSRSTSNGGLGAADSDLQWIVDSYVLVFAGLLLTAGALGDRFGRYRALAFGLAVFGVGSLLAAKASSSGMLITFRALMGVGGAFIMPATLSIITNVFRDPKERGRAIGVWAGLAGLGLAIGPVTGGTLLEHFWWGSVLLVNLPIVAIGLVGGFFLVPDSRDPAAPKLDVPGAFLSIVGLATLLWGLIEGPTKGWRSGPVLGAFAIGLALMVAFVAWERRTDHPMLDINFFRNPRFSAASAAITLTFMALMGMIFMLTQFLQSVLEFSPVKAGAVLIPMSGVMMVLAPMSARFVERLGTKRVLGTGLLIVSLSLVLLARLGTDSSALEVILVTMVMGAGMANVMAPATESVMGSLPVAVRDAHRLGLGRLGPVRLGARPHRRQHPGRHQHRARHGRAAGRPDRDRRPRLVHGRHAPGGVRRRGHRGAGRRGGVQVAAGPGNGWCGRRGRPGRCPCRRPHSSGGGGRRPAGRPGLASRAPSGERGCGGPALEIASLRPHMSV